MIAKFVYSVGMQLLILSAENRDADIIAAIRRRLANCRKEFILHSIIGLLISLLGVLIVSIVWIYFRKDGSEHIKQGISLGMTLVTTGIGGYFVKKALSFREKASRGEEWLEFYQDATRPPPRDDVIGKIESKIFEWLG